MQRTLFTLLLAPFCLLAFDDTPRCFRFLETQLFDPPTVNHALDLYHVNQARWPQINAILQNKLNGLDAIMRARAKGMRPSPFERPFNREAVRELLMSTLYGMLQTTLNEYYVTDENDIRGIFEYIILHHQAEINACLGPPPKK